MQPMINFLLDPVVNFGKVTVSTGYGNLDTVIVLAAGDGSKLPHPDTDGNFNLVWFNNSTYSDPADDPNVEIVRCTARTGDVLIIARHQEGTTASNKNIPAKVYKMLLSPTKKTIDDIQTESQSNVNSHAVLTTAHGSTSAVIANTIVQRDASGRAQVAAPSAAGDIAIKSTVDTVQTNLNNHDLPIVISNTNSPFTAATATIILCNAVGGNIIVNLPAVASTKIIYNIKKTDTSANTITITPNGADTVELLPNLVIYAQGDSYTLVPTGSNWSII